MNGASELPYLIVKVSWLEKANYSRVFYVQQLQDVLPSLFPSRMFASPLFTVQIDLVPSHWSSHSANSPAIGLFNMSQEIDVIATRSSNWSASSDSL